MTSRSDASWAKLAYLHLRVQVGVRRDEFIARDVMDMAYAHGLPRPANEKAWGPIFVRANRAMLIVELLDVERDFRSFRPRLWQRRQLMMPL